MRIVNNNGNLKVWLSANDTYNWATRTGASWPCSQLRGKRVFAEFEANGDLVDAAVNGKESDVDSTEFDACMGDHIARKFPDHPAIR